MEMKICETSANLDLVAKYIKLCDLDEIQVEKNS